MFRDDVEPTKRRTRRQAGGMAKAEQAKGDKHRKTPRLSKEIDDAIEAAEAKKAENVVVLDLRKAAGFTDFFLICSGTNPRQIRAIADSVMETLAAEGTKPARSGEWPLARSRGLSRKPFGES